MAEVRPMTNPETFSIKITLGKNARAILKNASIQLDLGSARPARARACHCAALENG
jgi:hypothetical protein